ncbi:MAG TPA: permease [Actinomycetota bacterium]|nr:permease [Actinomycetota bacterium]
MAQLTTTHTHTRIIGRPARDATARTAVAVVAVLVGLALLLRLVEPQRFAWVQTFFIIFGSLLIQALPFVLVGALASALIEVFVPIGTLERLADLPRPLQLPAAALAGVAMPICECGSVPVARRLTTKGLLPSAAVTFMLAAPVVNPVVIASTFVAYRGREALWTMVAGRFLLGILVSVTVGWVLGAVSRDGLLRPNPDDRHVQAVEFGPPEPRSRRFFLHLGGDFLFMGRYLVLGATFAALVQTFLPASWISRVASLPVISIAAMMILAALLSLCSESDAFIAASFVQFGAAAQLAFLVFGPMVDLKLVTLYAGTFRTGFVRTVVITTFATTLVATLWLQLVIG